MTETFTKWVVIERKRKIGWIRDPAANLKYSKIYRSYWTWSYWKKDEGNRT